MIALEIAAPALPFNGVGGTGRDLRSLFVGVRSGVVGDTPDEVKGVALR